LLAGNGAAEAGDSANRCSRGFRGGALLDGVFFALFGSVQRGAIPKRLGEEALLVS
jgi:hypothetical protein